jgi:hypothetical protein
MSLPSSANTQYVPTEAEPAAPSRASTVVLTAPDDINDPHAEMKIDVAAQVINQPAAGTVTSSRADVIHDDNAADGYSLVTRNRRARRSPPPPPTSSTDSARAMPVSDNLSRPRTNETHVLMPHQRLNPSHLVPIGIPIRDRYLDKGLIANIPVIRDVEQKQFTIDFDLPFEKCKDVVMTNKWKINARRLVRAKTNCPLPIDMHDVHPDRRNPIFNALEYISGAKIISPSEETLIAFQHSAVPASVIAVRIVLFYYDNRKAANAKRAFTDEHIQVSISHPSAYCGRVYNVPVHHDAAYMHRYVFEATNNAAQADSFAFRRLFSPSTALPTTTFEWAALSDAADMICNVQIPTYANGDPIGMVWRVATRNKRLPDTLITAGVEHTAVLPRPIGPATAPTMQRNYASIVSSGPYRQPPNAPVTIAATVSPPTLPASTAVHPPSSPIPDTTITALLRQIEQMQAAAERREKEQNEFNVKLLDRMSNMMKSSIDQFTNQMQLFHSVLVAQTNALANLTTAVTKPLQSSETDPPPPTPTNHATLTRQRRTSSTATPSRRRQQASTAPESISLAPVPGPSSTDSAHSSDSTIDGDVSRDGAVIMSQLDYSQTTAVSTASSIASHNPTTSISLHSLSSSDDSANDPDERRITTVDTNNVIIHSYSGEKTTKAKPFARLAQTKSASRKSDRDRSHSTTRLTQSQSEKQREYAFTRPSNKMNPIVTHHG